jgi:peptidyl-prolyl cis-trans isomerase D
MIIDIFRKTQTLFTKTILIILALTFAFGFGFGISHLGSMRRVPKGIAAEVNGDPIAVQDFYRVRDAVLREYRKAGLPEDSMNINVIGIQALNQLVDSKLLAQEAKRMGFRVSDEELERAITSNPSFQYDGKFIGADAYRRLVENAFNESVREFERKYREELLASKVVRIIFDSAVVSDEELYNIYRMGAEKVNLKYIEFPADKFKSDTAPSEEEIKTYYDANVEQFKAPEKRVIRYFTLGDDFFGASVNVSEEEMRAYYEAHLDEFGSSGSPEGGEGRPTYEKVKDEIRESLRDEKLRQARLDYLSRLKSQLENKPLEQLSRDAGVAEIKTSSPFELGSKSPDLPEEVVKAAFALASGKRAIRSTESGVWVFEVKEIIPQRTKGMEEVREEVASLIAREKAVEKAKAEANKALEALRKGKMGLDDVAKEFGLELKETGMFTRLGGVPGIDSEDLKLDAFSLTELGQVAGRVYETRDSVFIVALKDKEVPDEGEFEGKREALRERELRRRRMQLYGDWVQKLREKATIKVNDELFAGR